MHILETKDKNTAKKNKFEVVVNVMEFHGDMVKQFSQRAPAKINNRKYFII